MFGVGMTLASGCTSKTLIRLGGGNLKSIFVLITVGIFAYLMTMTDFLRHRVSQLDATPQRRSRCF